MPEEKSKIQKRYKNYLIVAAVLIIAIIIALIYAMRYTINQSVYTERKELLGRLTESSTDIIDDNLEYGQSVLDIIADNTAQSLKDYSSVEEYFDSVRNRDSYKDLVFFLVDANGKYYSSDGVCGKIVDTTYYTDSSEEKLSYISSLPHMDAQKAYLIFRNRFEEPLLAETENGSVQLLYCGYLFDIDGLNEIVSNEFAGDNNTFIYEDASGVMLYKNFGITKLIDGFNIYPKFEQSKILYGEVAEECVQSCRNRETLVVLLEINGEKYYFSSSPINHKGWSVAFIVQSSALDEISNHAFGKIITYVSFIAAILGLVCVAVIAVMNKNRVTRESLGEIRQLNTKLEEASSAKSDFLSNMSHDIRTPINGIMGMTTIAKSVKGNPEKTQECLNKIEGSAKHLLSLINDVLDITRIEKGKTEIAAKPIDIRMVMDNCSSIIKGQMSGRAIRFVTEIQCEHTRIIGDDLRLRQIFINLLGNAVKFTKDGGAIWFRCLEIDSDDTIVNLSFEVEDTGIGMSKEFLPKIFDAFTQDNAGMRSEYVGTGLGMPITKQLTELMGGSIRVESELGQGSRFIVNIPFVMNSQKAEEEEEEGRSYGQDVRGLRLLLAEDNELNTEIAVELLSDAGAEVICTKDGKEVYDCFRRNEPGTFDAILMDIMMPVMNGIEATKAIRALPRPDAKTIPIIAMTANAFESDVQATKEAGMNAHLAKPINIKEVLTTIAMFTKKGAGE